jgi:predicted metal-dependent hydrolase
MLDTKKYDIEIVHKNNLKHSYISISQNKKITLKTPYGSQSKIDAILKEKQKWIDKKLLEIDSRSFLGDEEIYDLSFLEQRVLYFSKVMKLEYTALKFRKMKRRWGSCNSKKRITLNKELCKLPQNLIDYVVVHELAHIKHMNHSEEFHQLIKTYLPDASHLRTQLKKIAIG